MAATCLHSGMQERTVNLLRVIDGLLVHLSHFQEIGS